MGLFKDSIKVSPVSDSPVTRHDGCPAVRCATCRRRTKRE